MPRTPKFALPYEAAYTGHLEAERRREETREWLRQRQRELRSCDDAPSLLPEAEIETKKQSVPG